MSRIYVGNPLQGAGLVVIKQLRVSTDPSELAEDLQQFEKEYRILLSLQHPSLPRALDFFEQDGRHYLVEEYVPGETLEARIASQGRLSPTHAVAIALQLLDVLGYLHQRRIIYRDLKPSNILLGRDNTLRLVDFGAARIWKEDARRDTVPLGTPGFASPEHYGRAQTDARSDLYCVGAVLHYMLSGVDPQDGQPWSFEPPQTVHQDIPASLGKITMMALELDPARRFQSVDAMRRALSDLAFELPDSVHSWGEGGVRRLTTLRRRLQYPHPQEYYRVLETLGLGLFGVFFFAVSIPAWFANVPLPHPLVGAWLTAYAFVHPYSNWKRYRSLVVEIFLEGMRVSSYEGVYEVYWSDVVRMRMVTPGTISARSADIVTRCSRLHLDGVWPGFSEVVSELIQNANLAERSAQAPWYYQVNANEKIYERVS